LILETTANGLGEFHQFWMEKRKAFDEGRTEWIPIFLPWKDHAEYVREFPSEAFRLKFQDSLTAEEKDLMQAHELSLEQMNWRRHQIEDVYNHDEERFRVEFPLTEDDAFQSTSKRVYPDVLTRPQRKHVIEDRDVRFRGEMAMMDRRPAPIPDPKGFLKIFKEAQPDWQYVIGADSCESALSHDEACAIVLSRQTWEQVAHLHGHIAPDQFARDLFALGMYYNTALIVPERNGPGAVTIHSLLQLYYPNVCKTPKMVFDNTGRPQQGEDYGFHTNVKSKPLIVERLATSLRNLLIILHDSKTIRQLETYVIKDETGHVKYQAEEGHYDDCVMALALAVWYCHMLPANRIASAEPSTRSFLSGTRTGYG